MNDYCLLIDTSLRGAALALTDLKQQPSCLLYFEQKADLENTPALLGEMATRALTHAGISWQQVQKICLSSGPGSFTGIRTGISWALGCKAGSVSIALASCSALTLLVEGTKDAVFLASTKTHGFVSYKSRQDQLQKTCLLNVQDQEQMEHVCSDIHSESQIFVLESWPALEAYFSPNKIVFENKSFLVAQKEALLSMLQHIDQLVFHKDHLPQPVYMRASSAEEQRDKRRTTT